MYLLLGFFLNWEMFLSESPQARVINPYPRTTIYDYCEQINVSGDILYSGGNVEEQEDYGFSGSLKKKNIIIDGSTKNKLTRIKRTPLTNIDEQQFMNPICEDTNEK